MPEQQSILVQRAGLFHVVDTSTDCAVISMGAKEAEKLIGKGFKRTLTNHPRPIHTMMGTLAEGA